MGPVDRNTETRELASTRDWGGVLMAAIPVNHETSTHAQDSTVGRVGVVLDALAEASGRAGAYTDVDVAVAYASEEGVRLLDEKLAGEPWHTARKRFLVSLDFGFTQPKALERLRQLANAEVRVPNGRAVLASPTLRPPSAFHAKVFAFRGDGAPFDIKALIVGSANLTASALSTGAEVITKQVWLHHPGGGAKLQNIRQVLDWFNDTWETADLLTDVLDEYRSRYRSLPKPRRLQEEKTPATRRYIASPNGHVITGALPVQLAAARALWVDGASIIHNRQTRPGNQLNTRRGTRVFFGYGSENVPRNTTLGQVHMRVGGNPYVLRSVRFGDNSMDIIGLPIPENNGLDTYEGSFLVFTRDTPANDGRGRFTLTTTDAAGLASLKEAAANSIELAMDSGRGYGLLF